MDIMDIMMAKAISGGGGSSSGGDSDLMIVPITYDGDAFSTDTDYADVVAAIQAGKTVIYKAIFGSVVFLSVSITLSQGEISILFLGASGDGVSPSTLYHTADGISTDSGGGRD